MTVLVFRTDSTDLFKPGAIQQSKPRMMRLQAALFSSKREQVAVLDALIRPEGWSPNAGAAAAHGITVRRCELFGVRPKAALAVFMDMVRSTSQICAAGLSFHRGIIDVELARLGARPEEWDRGGLAKFCLLEKAAIKFNAGKAMKLPAALEAAGIEWKDDKMAASIALAMALLEP